MEIWKPIVDYEGLYEISNYGRVRTVERKVGNRTLTARIRKPDIMKGYHCIGLIKDKHTKVYRIHRLVMAHFGLEQPSVDHQINHIDGDKSNNQISNLEWVTPWENTHHAIENGLRRVSPTEETRRKISERGKVAQNKPERLLKNRESARKLWEKRRGEGWTSWKTWNRI